MQPYNYHRTPGDHSYSQDYPQGYVTGIVYFAGAVVSLSLLVSVLACKYLVPLPPTSNVEEDDYNTGDEVEEQDADQETHNQSSSGLRPTNVMQIGQKLVSKWQQQSCSSRKSPPNNNTAKHTSTGQRFSHYLYSSVQQNDVSPNIDVDSTPSKVQKYILPLMDNEDFV